MTLALLAVLCGGAVGFSLGLIGGGGSILAVPLVLYVVGVGDPHIAIGTSVLAVSINALTNLVGHWRAGNVNWPCASVFAASGVLGALLGSTLGKAIDGQKLLFLFALVMVAVGLAMLRPRKGDGVSPCTLNMKIGLRLSLLGFAAGFISGFFGIGGGFLIVPGIMFGSGMAILPAIGCSLVSVAAFGLTTAINYAVSGLINWTVALQFIAGGAFGGFFGMRAAVELSHHKQALTRVFVAIIFAAAAYIMFQTGAGVLTA